MTYDANLRINSDRETQEIDAPAPSETRSHRGTQVVGCTCADCEDTRERLKVSMEAMVMFGAAGDICRCDGCDHWRVDGDPMNERIGRGVYCPSCAAQKKAALQAVTLDFEQVRR